VAHSLGHGRPRSGDSIRTTPRICCVTFFGQPGSTPPAGTQYRNRKGPPVPRNGHDWVGRYPAIVAAAGGTACTLLLIDGEAGI
jgi:hypothetical protein